MKILRYAKHVTKCDSRDNLQQHFFSLRIHKWCASCRPGILKDIHKRFIMYQLLSATQYLHSGNVIHRDQKPSNILLDTECNCKIADFGLARSLSAQQTTGNIHIYNLTKCTLNVYK